MNTRTVVLEEVDHMLAAGESPDTIAHMLGIRPGSVARTLYRAQLPDTARAFESARRASESGVCVDCGARITSRKATRCRRCGCVERERARHEGAVRCGREGCPRYLTDGRCLNHGTRVAA